MAVVYHWKHGWIPLDHAAALSKAKGDRGMSDADLNAAIARVEKHGGMPEILKGLRAEKARRQGLHSV